MDLDSIKKTWQEANIKPTIDESKIQKMLDNKGKSAYANLLKYDKCFLWLLIPCVFAGVLFYCMHPLPGILYFALLIPAFFWQLYKISYLKKADVSKMGILEISKGVTRYKKFLVYEIIIGAVWIVAFSVSYIYYGLPSMFPKLMGRYSPEGESSFMLLLLIFMIAATMVFSFLIYKYLYLNNIKKIQDSIREIEDFEKDNVD